jgi:signal transduction histidine kinase
MLWAYIATGALSVMVGITFFPRRRYRFWWQWLADQHRYVALSILAFCLINAGSAIVIFALAHVAKVGSDNAPYGRILAAVTATQAVLRGRAPRYGQTSSAERTLINRISEWFILDLDSRATEAVVSFTQELDLHDGLDLAQRLHHTYTVPDPHQTQTVKANESRRIRQARERLAANPPQLSNREDVRASDQPSRRREAIDPEEEMRRLCREIILRSHASLSSSQMDRYGR